MNRNLMRKNSWILSPNLLFRPTVKIEVLMEVISNQINRGADPLISIAYSIDNIMEAHVKKNLEPISESLKISFKTSIDDLYMLRLGYRYIVSTAIFTILCKDLDEKERVPYAARLLERSENDYINKVQTEIIKDLRATINLYNLDRSGAFIFQFLADNSPFDNEYFLAGMEMAIVLFSGLSQEVERLHPELHWPPPVQENLITYF